MDNLIERYLSKFGITDLNVLNAFNDAIFKDYIYIKESQVYKTKVILKTILNCEIYESLFSTQNDFARNGGFTSDFTFIYLKEDDASLKEFVSSFVNFHNYYDLELAYIENKVMYFGYTDNEEDIKEEIVVLNNILLKINSTYKAVSFQKIEFEEEEIPTSEDEEVEIDDNVYDDIYKEEALAFHKDTLARKKAFEEREAERRSFHAIQLKDFDKFERVVITGKIFNITEDSSYGKTRITLYIYDGTSSVAAKFILNEDKDAEKIAQVSRTYFVGQNVQVKGRRNDYKGFITLTIIGMPKILDNDDPIEDNEEEKRVELHLHTNMSAMDGVTNIEQYLKFASSLGHKALGLTDHGCVQSFPTAQSVSSKLGIKVLYGAELYVVDKHLENIMNSSDVVLRNATYVSFDLETTGLSARYDRIIEFGAVKVSRGIIEDEVDFFVNPDMDLPDVITKLTGITTAQARSGKSIKKALQDIIEFVGDSILVSHNAAFDVGFLNEALKNNGLPQLTNPVIDTLPLSRYLFPKQRSHTLGSISRTLDVDYDESEAHRAIYDAQVLRNVYEGMLALLSGSNQELRHCDLDNLTSEDVLLNSRPFHVTVYAKNAEGLKDLFKIVSLSNIEYLASVPLVPRDVLTQYRKNLIIGSGCLNGEIFQNAMTRSESILKEKMKYYDFIEVQPPAVYTFLVNDGQVSSMSAVLRIIEDVIKASKSIGKLVCATGDVHYLRPEQKQFRDVYIFARGLKGAQHPLNPYRRASMKDYENPDQHYLTTKEMKDAFSFLNDEELVQEIVVKNTNLIADMIESIKPIKDKLYTPTIDNCAENLEKMVYETAHEMYGDPLPKEIDDRLNAELKGIRENNYYVIYYIASQLVTKTNDAGYLVGSRGSVGSSLIATMAKITEVNPLAPHYRCKKCHYLEWMDPNLYRSGFDLPHKKCPHCGEELVRDGQNIPFATFLGFHAEKVPDIDLNFPTNFQAQAHEMTKDLLGKDNVFKAGTIETVADKTAIGYVKGYYEHFNIDPNTIPEAERLRLELGCVDVKRTTGQHPGGIIVIPRDMSVYDFTPIQYPANSSDASWKTTHFDFHAIHDNVLKLDLLGHVDPYALKMMTDLTNVDIHEIPFDDKRVLSLFSSTKALEYKVNLPNEFKQFEETVGTLGVPEFGTSFVRQMLIETKPQSFSDLLIISGLSHGTDVYNGNVDEIIKSGKSTLQEVIGCRDDIMTQLHDKYGIEFTDSFTIMELVRKNNFMKAANIEKRTKYEKLMREHNVPEYYIESCQKIKYLFPKAHAVAYVMMAIRVAWFKIYHPLAYYATFFSLRCGQYDMEVMTGGLNKILKRLKQIDDTPKRQRTNIEASLYTTLLTAVEMARRGIKIEKISLLKSDASMFIVDEEKNSLIPPINLIPGLGTQVAESIVEERNKRPFTSEEDLLRRTRLGENKFVEIKTKYNTIFDIDELPESDQLTLF